MVEFEGSAHITLFYTTLKKCVWLLPELACFDIMNSQNIAPLVRVRMNETQVSFSISTQIIKAPEGANIITSGDGRTRTAVREWSLL